MSKNMPCQVVIYDFFEKLSLFCYFGASSRFWKFKTNDQADIILKTALKHSCMALGLHFLDFCHFGDKFSSCDLFGIVSIYKIMNNDNSPASNSENRSYSKLGIQFHRPKRKNEGSLTLWKSLVLEIYQ